VANRQFSVVTIAILIMAEKLLTPRVCYYFFWYAYSLEGP